MDDNTVKVMTLIISTISALGLAYVGYLTLQANLASQAATKAAKETATEVRVAAELVQTTAKETVREARTSAELVRSTLASTAAEQRAKSTENANKLDSIHGLVDGRLTAALAKIDALENRLFETEGRLPTGELAPPPADPSLPPPTIAADRDVRGG